MIIKISQQYQDLVREQNKAYFVSRDQRVKDLLGSVESGERKELRQKLEAIENEFYKAVARNNTEKVEQILNDGFAGLNINFPFAKGNTPLIEAANNGHLEMVNLLLARGYPLGWPPKNGIDAGGPTRPS